MRNDLVQGSFLPRLHVPLLVVVQGEMLQDPLAERLRGVLGVLKRGGIANVSHTLDKGLGCWPVVRVLILMLKIDVRHCGTGSVEEGMAEDLCRLPHKPVRSERFSSSGEPSGKATRSELSWIPLRVAPPQRTTRVAALDVC